MMLRFSKYWLFQSFGWLSFAFLNIYIAALLNELTKDVLIVNILISVIGFILSHQFRNYILKHKLSSLGTEKLLITLAVAISILSIIYNLIYYLCLYFLYYDTVFSVSASTVFGSFVSVFFLFSVWSIIYFAWTYIETNRSNLIERLKMESSLKDLELKTIRSNLQPHFIFNSLNSIRALIDENPELARKAITHISNILRSSITQQDITDTLENELTLVGDYLALEKIRFEERLNFSKEISASSLPIHVPTMMLQTIVENAIKHGISKLEKGGRIHIEASYNQPILQLEVINTGTLNLDEKNDNSLGFGLNSTKQRLKLIYNNDASFNIFEKDNMVHVLIKIKTS
jgi:two-component system LytT family sensor kinase